MVYYLGEFLDLCKKGNETKQILLNVNGKVIPMGQAYYIADEVWFNSISNKEESYTDNDSFIDIVEQECINNPNSWGDLYCSPMEHIGNCELRFANDFSKIENGTEKEYEIVKIVDNEKNIVIYLESRE